MVKVLCPMCAEVVDATPNGNGTYVVDEHYAGNNFVCDGADSTIDSTYLVTEESGTQSQAA